MFSTTMPCAKLDWDGPDDGRLAMAYVDRPDGYQDEYMVAHKPEVGGEYQWFWCAGHKIRYCEMVAHLRSLLPA